MFCGPKNSPDFLGHPVLLPHRAYTCRQRNFWCLASLGVFADSVPEDAKRWMVTRLLETDLSGTLAGKTSVRKHSTDSQDPHLISCFSSLIWTLISCTWMLLHSLSRRYFKKNEKTLQSVNMVNECWTSTCYGNKLQSVIDKHDNENRMYLYQVTECHQLQFPSHPPKLKFTGQFQWRIGALSVSNLYKDSGHIRSTRCLQPNTPLITHTVTHTHTHTHSLW